MSNQLTSAALREKWDWAKNDRDQKLAALTDEHGRPRFSPTDLEFHKQRIEDDYRRVERDLIQRATNVVANASEVLRKIEETDPSTRLTPSQLEKAASLMSVTAGDFATLPEHILAQRCQRITESGDPATRLAYLKCAQRAVAERFNQPGQGVLLTTAMKALEAQLIDTQERDLAQSEIHGAHALMASVGATRYIANRNAEFYRAAREAEEQRAARSGRPVPRT